MKKAFAVVAIAGSLAISTASNAADMPVKAPVAAPVAFTWTGIYIGAHAGWGHSSVDMSFPADVFFTVVTCATGRGFPCSHGNTLSGFLAGGHLGFNYQTGMFVFGLEVAGTWTDLDQRVTSPEFPALDVWSFEQKWIASGTARLGVAGGPGGRILGYVKGGIAATRIQTNLTCVVCTAGFFDDDTTTNWGWTAGAGLEWAFWDNWVLGIEYNHYDFEDKRHAGPGSALVGAPSNRDVDLTTDTVTARLSYKFGGFLLP